MENNFNDFNNDIKPLPEKPQFLRILCILSFIWCGLIIIAFGIGTSLLSFNEEMATKVWDQVLQTQPQLEDTDPLELFHELGMFCVYGLIANIISLVGVILMWRLNKFGFFIYAVAEIAINFFSVHIGSEDEKSYGGTIFVILIDLAFIIMYAVNLKHMNKKVVAIPQQ